MVRVVLDTNVIVSALFWGGLPRLALAMAIRGDYQLLTSEDLIDELRETLEKPKFAPHLHKLNRSIEALMTAYIQSARLVQPAAIPANGCATRMM